MSSILVLPLDKVAIILWAPLIWFQDSSHNLPRNYHLLLILSIFWFRHPQSFELLPADGLDFQFFNWNPKFHVAENRWQYSGLLQHLCAALLDVLQNSKSVSSHRHLFQSISIASDSLRFFVALWKDSHLFLAFDLHLLCLFNNFPLTSDMTECQWHCLLASP